MRDFISAGDANQYPVSFFLYRSTSSLIQTLFFPLGEGPYSAGKDRIGESVKNNCFFSADSD